MNAAQCDTTFPKCAQKIVQRRRARARMVKLITDSALCRSMGEAGRAKAEREFELERLVSETIAAYRLAGWMDRS
jgi:hypothetical protein